MNGYEVLPFVRGESMSRLAHLIETADAVIHLAGENRPSNISDFEEGNSVFTSVLCDLVSKKNSDAPIIFASSIQALLDNPYGRSKLAAEAALEAADEDAEETGLKAYIPKSLDGLKNNQKQQIGAGVAGALILGCMMMLLLLVVGASGGGGGGPVKKRFR